MCNNLNAPGGSCAFLSYSWVLWLFYYTKIQGKYKTTPKQSSNANWSRGKFENPPDPKARVEVHRGANC